MRAWPATEADLPGARAVADAHGDLWQWPTRPDYLDHELEHGRLVVAGEDGSIVGYGAVLERDGISYLADLFVHPAHLGKGAGREMMCELFPADGERFTFASGDPRALPLYVRFGMRPLEPLLYLAGDGEAVRRLGGDATDLREADPSEVADADTVAGARRRPQDLAFLRTIGATLMVPASRSREAAYGHVRIVPGREVDGEALLGPSGATTPEALAQVTAGLLSWAAGRVPLVRIAVMGSNLLLRDLFEAGFRVTDRDTFMASRPGILDGSRYQPSPVIG